MDRRARYRWNLARIFHAGSGGIGPPEAPWPATTVAGPDQLAGAESDAAPGAPAPAPAGAGMATRRDVAPCRAVGRAGSVGRGGCGMGHSLSGGRGGHSRRLLPTARKEP